MPIIVKETESIPIEEVSNSNNINIPCELFNCGKIPTELTSIVFPNNKIICKIYLCKSHLESKFIHNSVLIYLRKIGLLGNSLEPIS